ncbi:MAG TPA: hypothetical protein DHS57_00665 [Erysipelotrichaceae bacterium]|nr:hypothetical protein [Erysipelotrichaceae bacterium]
MLFSIIIPAYNASKHIENAINSVVKQPFFDYEIIIVNDGSKDNTLEIVNKLASKYMNIRVIAQSNSGASIARNNGIRHAKGEYIFFMDADDVIVENSLEKISNILNENKPDILIGLYKMINIDTNAVLIEKDNSIGIDEINNRSKDDVMKALSRRRLSSCPWRYFIKRKLILDNNLYFIENSLVEDAIWVPMLLTKGNTFCLNEEVFYQYQIHGNSVSTTKTFKFYEDALDGCLILNDYRKGLSILEKRLVDTYYMMLLVGVMQDYDSFNDENRNYVDKWLSDNLNDVIKASNSIKPLKFINKFIEPKKTLLYLGRYLKRKNRID